MSPKILKSTPSSDSMKFQFNEFNGAEGDFNVFEGNTVNLVEPPPLSEPEPVQDIKTPTIDIETIIRKAEQDAEVIRKTAREEAGKLEREAYEKGIAEGQKTGELMAQQKLDSILISFRESMKHLQELQEVATKDLTLDIIDLVVSVSEKVLRHEIQTHPVRIVEMVRDAIKSVKEKEKMIVFLNPEDFAYFNQHDSHARSAGMGGSVKLEQDGQLSRGSIKIKTSYGDVDASVETQLELIRKHVQSRLMELR